MTNKRNASDIAAEEKKVFKALEQARKKVKRCEDRLVELNKEMEEAEE